MLEVAPDALKKRIKEQEVIQRVYHYPLLTGDVYLVGGAIRELILQKTPNDYDFVLTEPDDLRRFEELFGTPAFILGKKPIQTHRIVTKDISIDITFLKTTLEEDLARRDFTMNGIAYDVKKDRIVDPLEGMGDIKKRLIRYPQKDTIKDDPLRMLKAIRHFVTLKRFLLHNELIEAIKELKHLINGIAPERTKYEIDQIISSEYAFEGMKLMEDTGLLFEIFPELYSLKQMDVEKKFELETYGHTIEGFKYLVKHSKAYKVNEAALKNVGYALLFHDLGKAYTFSIDEKKGVVHFFYHEGISKEISSLIMERLRFSSHEMKAIFALIENHMRIFLISNNEATEKATRRLVYKMGKLTPSLILLTLCDMYGSSGGKDNASTKRVKKRCSDMLDAYHEWEKEPLPKLINGYDLLSLGFTEGSNIGQVLEDIREKQISGEITEKAEALNYARDFLNNHKKSFVNLTS